MKILVWCASVAGALVLLAIFWMLFSRASAVDLDKQTENVNALTASTSSLTKSVSAQLNRLNEDDKSIKANTAAIATVSGDLNALKKVVADNKADSEKMLSHVYRHLGEQTDRLAALEKSMSTANAYAIQTRRFAEEAKVEAAEVKKDLCAAEADLKVLTNHFEDAKIKNQLALAELAKANDRSKRVTDAVIVQVRKMIAEAKDAKKIADDEKPARQRLEADVVNLTDQYKKLLCDSKKTATVADEALQKADAAQAEHQTVYQQVYPQQVYPVRHGLFGRQF